MNSKKNTIAIFNCYPEQSRKNFDASDVGHPHDLILDFLSRQTPDIKTKLYFIADLDKPLPTDEELSQCRGCIWTGSDLTIYQIDPRVERQTQLAKTLFKLGLHSIGSCWGIQMAVVAAGGKVAKNPNGREWGIGKNIQVTSAGKKSILLQNKPDVFDAFEMHLDEVLELPENTEILATNDHTKVQALEVYAGKGSFFGTQYHPEYNLFEMGRLLKARAEALVKENFFQNANQVIEYAEKLIQLHNNPHFLELRKELNIGEGVLDLRIKEQELRNWLKFIKS